MTETYMQNLVKYIKKNLSKGYTIESLKWALLNQGYSRTAVDRAIELTNEELSREAPIIKEKPKITIEREPLYPTFNVSQNIAKSNFWKKLKNFFED